MLSISQINNSFQNINSINKSIKKVDEFLDMNKNFDIQLKGLNKNEKNNTIKMIAKLLKKGIVGYQNYKIDGRIEKKFLTTSIGDSRLYDARYEGVIVDRLI